MCIRTRKVTRERVYLLNIDGNQEAIFFLFSFHDTMENFISKTKYFKENITGFNDAAVENNQVLVSKQKLSM